MVYGECKRPVLLALGLALMLGGCSTVDGMLSDIDRMFSRPEPVQQARPMTVEDVMGDLMAPAMPEPAMMSYDHAASAVSNSSVQLYSLDMPGRAVAPARVSAGTGTFGMTGVPSSADPSVTVFPFSEDMYTPGVRPSMYYGVRPPEVMAAGDIERIPAYIGQPNRIYFDHGSAALGATARQVIASVAQHYQGGLIAVEAHASQRAQVSDPVHRAEVNYRMSMRRAMAVTKQLIAQGVPAERIKTTALGDTRPVAEEVDARTEGLNRRVEILTGP